MSRVTGGRKFARPRGYIHNYRPQKKTRELLAQAQKVLDEYRDYWPLTCRQVFYRMVGRHGYEKTETAYARLCHHLANARRGKLIPFEAIRDDGVISYNLGHFDDRDAFMDHVRRLAANYKRNRLTAQKVHMEVWCEAAGMLPQLYRVAEPYSIPVYSSGGFDSVTTKKWIADRICDIEKKAIILHLGDYDPSGVSIFDSVADDAAAFVIADRRHALISVEFERVTLTHQQVQENALPMSPPKSTDSRSKSWKGGTCQLEALPPDVIAGALNEAIERRIDRKQLIADLEAEDEDQQFVRSLMLELDSLGEPPK
ncbi:hypothetical protein AB2B41_10395 [Marimonas sp. MJW-29]|uniref:Wadjet protein JetD C-terminal domain-containing protein n=1 Tax=Sulfitobacter sediminis TaxID=3234186 RepID=A0ABV3RM06_9RHOB